jgi:hypothetical protein
MNYIATQNNGVHFEDKHIVEIKLWSLYLLQNYAPLYSQVIEASLDRGPVEKTPQATTGKITLRFTESTWKNQIKKLLYSYRIPVVVSVRNLGPIQHSASAALVY